VTDTSPQATDQPRFTAETRIFEAELAIDWDQLKAFYRERGIHCLNCPAAEIESFADGAKLHKFDLDDHLASLNRLAKEHPFSGFPAPWWARLLGKIVGREKES
jgi:hypothetical protein